MAFGRGRPRGGSFYMSIGTGPDRFKPGDAHRRIRMKGEEK
nr:MAG TPA: hypothetical protein [Caudoviricetes sp.]